SGDIVSTLVSSGTTPGYNATAGFNMATGLGSMNVANVVNATGIWTQLGSTASTVTVSPASNSIISNQSLSVIVTVAGTSGTPTGTVTLTGDNYISAATSLSSGSTTITIPANTFSAGGSVTLTGSYSGDSTYAPETGTATITVAMAPIPTVTVTPSQSTINSSQSMDVTVSVTGANGVATGAISLSGGGYSSSALTIGTSPCTSATNCVFTIPANSFASFGNVTLTAHYLGDSHYGTATGTATVTVNQSVYALNATAPSAINRGTTATSTITGQTSSTGYAGTVTLNSCTLTSSTVTNPNLPPTCTVSGTITYASGTASGSGTATVSTTAATAELIRPGMGGKGWLGAGSGMVLAFLMFFGIPARRRSWRALLGLLVVMIALGSLSACGGGGGGGGGGTSNPGTSSGNYTFTVSGTSNPSVSPAPTTTFTVTVN
ncbi:MAG TPA: Ig-like domain repeat protein, partial [Terracidiphilus sp.]|nr:Ig-like domain repeat protein [Terracidiphilus sp.]